MQVIAHRGYIETWPENSLAAFADALASGADAVELDVRLCFSGEPVVIHDRTLKRLFRLRKPVSQMTLAELRKVDVAAGEPVSTLDEVLQYLAETSASPRILIEIKNWDRAAVEAIVKIVEKHCRGAFAHEQLPIIGQSWELLRLAKNLNPRASIGQSLLPLMLPASAALKLARYSGAEMLNVHHRFLTPKLVERAHQAGLAVNAWTVNSESDMKRMLAAKVDGIITDRPKLLNQLISGEASSDS